MQKIVITSKQQCKLLIYLHIACLVDSKFKKKTAQKLNSYAHFFSPKMSRCNTAVYPITKATRWGGFGGDKAYDTTASNKVLRIMLRVR